MTCAYFIHGIYINKHTLIVMQLLTNSINNLYWLHRNCRSLSFKCSPYSIPSRSLFGYYFHVGWQSYHCIMICTNCTDKFRGWFTSNVDMTYRRCCAVVIVDRHTFHVFETHLQTCSLADSCEFFTTSQVLIVCSSEDDIAVWKRELYIEVWKFKSNTFEVLNSRCHTVKIVKLDVGRRDDKWRLCVSGEDGVKFGKQVYCSTR